MAIWIETKSFIDNILEITALKSKILLTENNLLTLANRHPELEELASFINNKNRSIRIYPDEYNQYFLDVRKAIGNIPDNRDAHHIMATITKKLLNDKQDVEAAQKVIKKLIEVNAVNDPMKIVEYSIKYRANVETVLSLLDMLGEMQNRSVFLDPMIGIQNVEWDGIKKLDLLFSAELLPKNDLIYFDQEFINYLKENLDDITSIHWRNFERLVAEFFNKIGYTVALGLGQSDGGIDIRIFNTKNIEKGPPLIIVQCKRYNDNNLVDVNTVKAFYSDMLNEQAEIGLIATTSRIAPIGKDTIKARAYNIQLAEKNDIGEMITAMWRNHYKSEI